MPMTPDELAEMQTLIVAARKKPINFGICIGKKPDSMVIYLHRKKSPTMLGKTAKKAGDTAKVAIGTVIVKGKNLMLSIEGDVPSGLSKKARIFFKTQKMAMKVVVLDASGNVLESDGDDEEEETGGGKSPAPSHSSGEEKGGEDKPSPEAIAWKKVFDELDAAAKNYANSSADKASQVGKAWAAALGAAQKGNFKAALDVAKKIKPLLDAASDGAESKEAKKWAATHPGMAKMYEQVMAGKPDNRSQLAAAWAMAVEKAEANDHGTALKIIAKLKEAFDKLLALGDQAPSETDVIPDNVVPFQRASVLWRQTREKMLTAMTKLEDAIIAECKDDAELAPLADEARDLTKRLRVFDTALIDQLDAITNSAKGPDRDALKKQASGQIRTYATALNEPFFKDVDTNNGFVNVSIAATAREALVAIAKTLQ